MKGVAQLHIKRERGVMVLIAYGQTPRGSKYRKGTVPFVATDTQSPGFKSEISSAVKEIAP